MSKLSRRRFFQTSAAALGLSQWATRARASTGFIRQPYLQRLLGGSATVVWTSSQSVASNVLVLASSGAITSFPATITYFDPSVTGTSYPYWQYQADITGLTGGDSYQYQIFAGGQILAADPVQYSFTTPTTGNFSFLVLGDTGTDSTEQTGLIPLMLAETGISKLIHVGDIAYDSGTFPQFESNYFPMYAAMMSRMPFYTTPGNHEYMTNSAGPYLAVHCPPTTGVPAADKGRYYSYDWGDAHFVSLDSNLFASSAATARMLAWLEADLAASEKFWKFVYVHHPPYPTGAHLGDPLCVAVQQNVNPIVEKYGVQLVLSGHEHGYERSFPLAGGQQVASNVPSTTYLITGGGGAFTNQMGSLPQTALALTVYNYTRVDVTGTSLTFTGKALDGSIIDQVTLSPPPAIAVNGIVNGGDFSPNIAPGSLVSIFGQNFAIRGKSFSSVPLPTQMLGVSVTANGVAAPLLYVSPGQLNIQMPFGLAGQVTLQITTANGTTTRTVNVSPTAPSIIAIASGNSFVSAANPAVPGGYVTVYATGLGAPAGTCPTGNAPSGAMSVQAPVQVLLGQTALQPSYAGLAPGFAGLNQVNVQIPAGLTGSVYSLSVTAGGVTSAPATLNVGAAPVGASADVQSMSASAHLFSALSASQRISIQSP